MKEVTEIHIENIRPNPYQPRTNFNESELEELSASIQVHGVLQPIIVRKSIHGYTIVAGERRFRASQCAGLKTVPAIIKEMSDQEMMELSIVENLQRENLTAIEEAESYQKLIEMLNISQLEVAQRLGKSRPYIANMVRLLKLPISVRNYIQSGALSGAHGRTLLPLEDHMLIESVAKEAMEKSWSVRTLEQYVDTYLKSHKKRNTSKGKPKFIMRNEAILKTRYGTEVSISKRNKKGVISFEFNSEKEFKRLMQLLQRKDI